MFLPTPTIQGLRASLGSNEGLPRFCDPPNFKGLFRNCSLEESCCFPYDFLCLLRCRFRRHHVDNLPQQSCILQFGWVEAFLLHGSNHWLRSPGDSFVVLENAEHRALVTAYVPRDCVRSFHPDAFNLEDLFVSSQCLAKL